MKFIIGKEPKKKLFLVFMPDYGVELIVVGEDKHLNLISSYTVKEIKDDLQTALIDSKVFTVSSLLQLPCGVIAQRIVGAGKNFIPNRDYREKFHEIHHWET